jgi:hypothetical protein
MVRPSVWFVAMPIVNTNVNTKSRTKYPPSKGNTLSQAVPGIHIVIPDTQIRRGVPTEHLEWAGRYIGENYIGRENVTIIHLGDHWDLPALSTWSSKREAEGQRLSDDIAAGNEGFAILDKAIKAHSPRSRRKARKIFLYGNHENRLERYLGEHPELIGSTPTFDTCGWETHPYLEPVVVDGVTYAHHFYQPNTGRPYGGTNIETRLKSIGTSFTMGHQQGLLVGMRNVLGRMHRGIVAGSFYCHQEIYRGPQQQKHWQGILVCHEVSEGDYSLMEVSLGYLCRINTGLTLDAWLQEREGEMAA